MYEGVLDILMDLRTQNFVFLTFIAAYGTGDP
jgi:hypothetical protein